MPIEDALIRRANTRVGSVLRGKWRIDHLLGLGGMANVYAATHRNGKRGAVKIMHPEHSDNEEVRRRFLREGYIANKVDHPGVVAVLDDDVAEDGSVFIVMELLEGCTVDRIPREKFDLATALALADQLLDVLAAAHDKGIVHRDLKPANLFFTRDGSLKVLDFGIARAREGLAAVHLTQVGHVMGTPAFMAPEQAHCNWEAVDGRTDLWAAGATLFALLTGRSVHEATTPTQMLFAAMTKPAPPIRSIVPDLPEPVPAIIDRALAFDSKDRWPDARAMQEAVRAAQRELDLRTKDMPAMAISGVGPSLPPSAPRPGEPGGSTTMSSAISHEGARPKPRRALGAILAGGAVAAAIAGILVFIGTRPAEPPRASRTSADRPTESAALPTSSPAETAPTASPGPVEVTPHSTREPPADPKTTADPRPRATLPAPQRAPAPNATLAPSSAPAAAGTPSGKPSPSPTGSADPFGQWE